MPTQKTQKNREKSAGAQYKSEKSPLRKPRGPIKYPTLLLGKKKNGKSLSECHHGNAEVQKQVCRKNVSFFQLGVGWRTERANQFTNRPSRTKKSGNR